MSIDRRIVSILYYNDIFDIEEVEKFLGENNNYYEIMIYGKVKKLKIPGYKYEELSEDKFEIQREEIVELLSQSKTEEHKPDEEWIEEKILIVDSEIEDYFEEEMKKTENENNLFLEKMKEEKEESAKEDKKLISKVTTITKCDVEPKKVETKKVEIKKPEPKKVEIKKHSIPIKPEKKVTTKKDIDDFMDTI